MILLMNPIPDNENPGSGSASRKHRAAGIIITVLGTVLLARGVYDYLAGSDSVQEVFMLGVSVLIVFLGLYRTFGSGLQPRR